MTLEPGPLQVIRGASHLTMRNNCRDALPGLSSRGAHSDGRGTDDPLVDTPPHRCRSGTFTFGQPVTLGVQVPVRGQKQVAAAGLTLLP